MATDTPTPQEMFQVVYAELRRLAASKLARERVGHTLSATALVHEAYLKLAAETSAQWSDRGQFLMAAAEAMRRILVDHARARKADKRGGGAGKLPLLEGDLVEVHDPDTLLSVDETLERLAEHAPDAAQVARMRLFAGLSVEEAGDAMGISRATAFREWSYARANIVAALNAAD